MSFKLPELPYPKNGLEPHINEETINYHYGKHHAGYVTKLNALANTQTELADMSLEQIIRTKTGKPYNLAAQIWNHTFYWNCMCKNGGGAPTGKIATLIDNQFGSFDAFKKQFNNEAGTHFGSGWAWVVRDDNNKLSIISTHDAVNPLSQGKTPVLTCDVWEHAYYIGFRNARGSYIDAWWNLINWEYVNKNLA
mmetsp:Transcript_13836/g.20956  ORF Transcript_13836/g.20956 Transcript_13836/m.20956 type:complete len:194 (+) Transcript_13836:38-619(+)